MHTEKKKHSHEILPVKIQHRGLRKTRSNAARDFPGELQKKVLRGVFQANTHQFIHTKSGSPNGSFKTTTNERHWISGWGKQKRAPSCLGYIGDEILHSYMGIINHEIRIQDPY